MERVKDFFKKAPEHALKVGDLVTCVCHGGVAIVIELYDTETNEAPSMNMHIAVSKNEYGCTQSKGCTCSKTYIRGEKVKTIKYKYTCWHCGTGMVMKIPAVCPECDRLLTKEA